MKLYVRKLAFRVLVQGADPDVSYVLADIVLLLLGLISTVKLWLRCFEKHVKKIKTEGFETEKKLDLWG